MKTHDGIVTGHDVAIATFASVAILTVAGCASLSQTAGPQASVPLDTMSSAVQMTGSAAIAVTAAGGDNDSTAPAPQITHISPGPLTVGPIVSESKQVTESPDQALKDSLKGVDPDVFVNARLGGSTEHDPTARYTFYATVKAAAVSDGKELLASWEAALVAGATAERLTESGPISQSIGWLSTSIVDPSGAPIDEYQGAIMPAVSGVRFAAADQSSDQIRSEVRTALDAFDLDVESIRVIHPLDPAIVVVVHTLRGGTFTSADFSTAGSLVATLGRSTSTTSQCRVEGYYFEVDDADGVPLADQADACRGGPGGSWVNPDAPFGVAHL